MILSPDQVQAHAAAILRHKRSGGSRVMALQFHGRWTGPEALTVNGEAHQVYECVSDLHLRECLQRLEGAGNAGILLCDFDDTRLGEDVVSRLIRRSIHAPRADEVLRELFSAKDIDARVLACKPLVEGLMGAAAVESYPPVQGGILDLKTAWLAFLSRLLHTEIVDVQFADLLRWCSHPARRKALSGLGAELTQELAKWMSPTNGDAPRRFFQVLGNELGADPIAAGLLCGVLLEAERLGIPEASSAAARLEQFLGDEPLSLSTKQTWYQAARTLLHPLAEDEVFAANEVIQHLDALLDRVRLRDNARLSEYSIAGLEQRFEDVAEAIQRDLQSSDSGSFDGVRQALDQASAHFSARSEGLRLRRLEMAARLCRWCRQAKQLPLEETLSKMVATYYQQGSFLEWARNLVTESDPNPKVREALQSCLLKLDGVYSAWEQGFAVKVKQWNEQGSQLHEVLCIEQVLPEVVGPAAALNPALLIVLDGMSMAVFRELCADLTRKNWVQVNPGTQPNDRPVFATVPSVTEISRRALLSGRLPTPLEGGEVTDFSRNERVLQCLGGSSKPQLFLKGDLVESGRIGLSATVAQAIRNPRCRLVGVVVNAIDDTLGSTDQTTYSWGLDQITPLHELLSLAVEAERVVILTSDHGHVLDGGTQKVDQPLKETGDRYRLAGGVLAEGEYELKGPRIRAATRSDSVVALGSSRLRYQGKRRGYHGGICPAELVVPCAMFRAANCALTGEWVDLAPFEPEWWSLRPVPQAMNVAGSRPTVAAVPRAKATPSAQMELLPVSTPAPPSSDWVELLLASEVYAEQAQLTVRGNPPPEQLSKFLRLLEQRHGSLLRAHCAQHMGIPILRVDGLIQNYRRLLNVDGYDVLSYDPSSESITLNIALLKTQFGV